MGSWRRPPSFRFDFIDERHLATALRAVAVSARVVAVAIVVARIASVDFSAHRGCPAEDDVFDGTFVRCHHAAAILCHVFGRRGPQDVGHFGAFGTPVSELIHEAVDDVLRLVLRDVGEMGHKWRLS